MSNQNSLPEIQQKYKDCNLLLPTSSEVQLNPFYKYTVMEVVVDTSEKSGDIFKVGSSKIGNQYVDVFSPAKPLLMKLASAAGIQFDPNHTYGARVDKNTYRAKAFGAIRLPDGSGKTHADEKVICLDDEEENYRLEFMDKSIKGITDEKAAKAAESIFSGKWIDSINKWNKPCKAYVIDDCDREKYIDRSVMVNMTLLRKTVSAKAMTGAILRVIRALIGMKGTYTKEELSKPFAITRVTFSPDYSDPMVRQSMIQQGMNSMNNMFGSAALETNSNLMSTTIDNVTDSDFNLDEDLENPAFSTDVQEDSHPSDDEDSVNSENAHPEVRGDEYACDKCGCSITEKVYEYSINKIGNPLCVKCQKGAC